MDYTVEIYKTDRRRKDGRRLMEKREYKDSNFETLKRCFESLTVSGKYVVEIHQTYVTKRNAMTGVEFKERYDVPYFCSPSSETYWSM